jgi:NADH-quinone oxidoreductase subunit M
MIFRRTLRSLVLFSLTVLVMLSARAAFADGSTIDVTPHGIIALSTDHGAGPLVLSPEEANFRGEFTVTNNGDDPLFVSRVAPRGDDDDVRSPSKLSAKFVEGNGISATIAPHTSKRVSVSWSDHDPRVKQLFGEIVVTSTDDAAGEVAMGVRVQTTTALPVVTDHPLSWIIALPFLGALLIMAMSIFKFGNDELVERIALGSTGAAAAIALWVFHTFDGNLIRADGNDGFQMIERFVWIRSMHTEYFVAVDGLSVTMVSITAVVAFLALLATSGERSRAFYVSFLLLASSIVGLFVALDLLLFYAFWCAMFLSAYRLVNLASGEGASLAASKLGFVGLVASAILLIAISGLYQHSGRTFLVDGSPAQHVFGVPELMHVTYNNPGATMFGVALVKGLWVALFVPFMLLAAVAPLHTWLVNAVDEGSASVSALLAACAVEVGIYGMLRFNYGILPEATRWAAGAIVGLGAASIVYGGLCAFAQTDLKKFVAYASVSHAGVALLGVGSLTPEGVAGACIEMSAHAIAVAALVLAVGAIEDRARIRNIDGLEGVAREMPLLGSAFVLSLAASFGVPGLVGFWGECLAAIGTYAGYRIPVIIAVAGLAIVAASHIRVLDKIAFGKIAESWQKSPYLEPFGGTFPDLGARELGAIGPLVILLVLLGLWPAPLLTTISGSARDTSALVNPPGPDQIALR